MTNEQSVYVVETRLRNHGGIWKPMYADPHRDQARYQAREWRKKWPGEKFRTVKYVRAS